MYSIIATTLFWLLVGIHVILGISLLLYDSYYTTLPIFIWLVIIFLAHKCIRDSVDSASKCDSRGVDSTSKRDSEGSK